MQAAEPRRPREGHADVAVGAGVAKHQAVAIHLARLGQLVRRDVVKRRNHLDAFAQQALGALGRAALRRQLHAHDPGRDQRHGGVDDDLANRVRRDLGHGLGLGGEGNRDHDNVGAGRRLGVGRAGPRPDDDLQARRAPPAGQGRAQAAGAADDRDGGVPERCCVCLGHAAYAFAFPRPKGRSTLAQSSRACSWPSTIWMVNWA